MILVVDNHDSFTWNLVRYLKELGAEVWIARSDALSAADALASGARAILISPGPGRPEDAGVSVELVTACAAAGRPLLGVCLGHQAIGQAFGAAIVRAPEVMHGKTSLLSHHDDRLFAAIPSPFTAARYHSLVVDRSTLPADLLVTAEADDGTVQALRHRHHPINGVQFHPESVASEHGHRLLRNFLRSADVPLA